MLRGEVTNLEIQKWIARNHSFVPETVWVEACKREWGLTPSDRHAGEVCPADKKPMIRQAFRAFGLLS